MSGAESAAGVSEAFKQEELFEDERPGLKSYHPNKFSQRHKLVCTLHAAGLRNVEIAEVLDYSEERVSMILNDPRAEKHIQQAAKAVQSSVADVGLRLKLLASEAVDELEYELRAVTDVKVRQRAAFGVLDRAGYGRMETQVRVSGELSDQAVEELSDALREENVIEADYDFVEPDDADYEAHGDSAGRDGV